MTAIQYERFGGPEVFEHLDLPNSTGQITASVDEVSPLSQVAEAHRRLESREVRGVVVLDPTSES